MGLSSRSKICGCKPRCRHGTYQQHTTFSLVFLFVVLHYRIPVYSCDLLKTRTLHPGFKVGSSFEDLSYITSVGPAELVTSRYSQDRTMSSWKELVGLTGIV